MKKRFSQIVHVGNVPIGGDYPVVVQSMSKTDTRDVKSTVSQINELADCGCEIIRVAIPDSEAADSLAAIKRQAPIPVIADIHFDYRLALAAIKSGADGLRLNPGNINNPDDIQKVVHAAKQRGIPIRVGVNFGSLPPADNENTPVVDRMVNAAIGQVRLLESMDFNLIKIAVKAFDVPTTIEAYRLLASKIPYPLHLGITESGLPRTGIIRSAAGIGILLYEGIGDTIRVSLSSHPHDEVFAAFEILKSLNLRRNGPLLVSCPTCGRTETDVIGLAESADKFLNSINKTIKVAVMGCVVNGPGEAKDADVGIACGKGRGVIFTKGKITRTVDESDYLEALIQEIKTFLADR